MPEKRATVGCVKEEGSRKRRMGEKEHKTLTNRERERKGREEDSKSETERARKREKVTKIFIDYNQYDNYSISFHCQSFVFISLDIVILLTYGIYVYISFDSFQLPFSSYYFTPFRHIAFHSITFHIKN